MIQLQYIQKSPLNISGLFYALYFIVCWLMLGKPMLEPATIKAQDHSAHLGHDRLPARVQRPRWHSAQLINVGLNYP